jgi:hypothetical protein
MTLESSSRRQRFVSFVRKKYLPSARSIKPQLPHWVYAACALGVLAALAIGILQAGYAALPNRASSPTPSLPTPRHYPTPTPMPDWDGPTAFVSARVLRIFSGFGALGDIMAELRNGDRVQVLARSADGAWTQIRTGYGVVGWARTNRLVMANASHAPVPTVQGLTYADVLCEDDFQDPQSGWGSYADETGESFYQNGEYVIRVSRYGWTWWPQYPQGLLEYEIEADARPVVGENVSYGLVFQFGASGGYLFVIDLDGYYNLFRILNDQWIRITDYAESDAINQGHRTNRLKIKVKDSQISLSVNDQFLQTVTDTTFDGGWIGLAVRHFDYSEDNSKMVEVRFDDLEVKCLTCLTQEAVSIATPQVTSTPVSQPEPTPTAPRGDCLRKHFVGRGEDLYLIALRYGVSETDIRTANGSKPDVGLLKEGSTLCIPAQPATGFMTDVPIDPTPVPGSGCRFIHVVRAGEGWYQIEMRYGVSAEDILEASDLRYGGVDFVNLEETLCIP